MRWSRGGFSRATLPVRVMSTEPVRQQHCMVHSNGYEPATARTHTRHGYISVCGSRGCTALHSSGSVQIARHRHDIPRLPSCTHPTGLPCNQLHNLNQPFIKLLLLFTNCLIKTVFPVGPTHS